MRQFIKFSAYFLIFLMVGAPFAIHAKCNEPKRGPPGPRGMQGRTGRPGTSSFTPDVGSVLSFTNAFQPGGILPEGSILIPYVVAPNGVVTEGTPIIADGILTDFLFSPIIVANPVFGIYHTGVQVTLSADFTPGLIFLTSKVVSDRAGPTPAETTLVGEGDTFLPDFPLLAGNQFQITADFTYGPGNIP